MNIYHLELQELIATGQAKDAAKKLMSWLVDCKKKHPEGEQEVENLQRQVMVLSGNLATAQNDYLANLINRDSHNISVAQVSSGLANIINDLDQYTVFSVYLNGVEEEAIWSKAREANSIEEYETYLLKYTKGKYSLEATILKEGLKQKSIMEEMEQHYSMLKHKLMEASDTDLPTSLVEPIQEQRHAEHQEKGFICNKCNAELKELARFCVTCGDVLPPATIRRLEHHQTLHHSDEPATFRHTVFCGNCGTKNAKPDKFCLRCGENL